MFISAVQGCCFRNACVYKCVCVCVCAADNAIHLYDTSGSKFDEVKTVEARDVGWSILDVVFR